MKCKFLIFNLPTCKIILLFTCFSLSGLHSLKSQDNAVIDSLLRVIAISNEDTGKVSTLVELSNTFLANSDLAQSYLYINEAKALAEKLNFKPGMVRVFFVTGNLAFYQNQYSMALVHYNNALQLANDIQHIKYMAKSNYHIGFTYARQNDYLTAIRYHMECRKLYESLKDEAWIAITNGYLGTWHYSLGNPNEAIKYYELALKSHEKIKDRQGIAEMKRNIGNMYAIQGNNLEALKLHFEALKLNEDIGNQFKIAETNNGIGIIYYQQRKMDDALRYHLMANKGFRESGEKYAISQSYNNISNVYAEKGDLDKAIENLLLSIEIKEEINYKAGLFASYFNLSMIYIQQGRNAEAMKYMLAAHKISEELGDKASMGTSYEGLGRLAIALDSLEEARRYLLRALDLSNETGSKPIIPSIYLSLAKLDSVKGDYKQSLAYFKLYAASKDSLVNENSTKAFDELQTKYETEKKDKEIKNLENKQEISDLQLKVQRASIHRVESENALNRQQLLLFENESKLQRVELEKSKLDIALQKSETQLQEDRVALLSQESEIKSMRLKKQTMLKNYLLIGIGCAMIVGFFVYRNHTTRQKLKLQILRNKIANDLHDDVGSTLSSISIFSEMAQAQSKEVIPLLNTIQESSRKMLEAMADIVWTINPENDQFEKILMRMRNFAFELLGAREIDFEFNADEEINNLKLPMDVRKNLYLIFKEATNNMVKYSGASEAEFSIKNVEDKIVLIIRDNGKGFDMNQPSEGNGIKSMRKRAAEMGADFILRSLPGKGTSIELKIAV